MPVPLSEVDEVWLALNEAKGYLHTQGHKPNEFTQDCSGCRIAHLVQNGIDVYLKRMKKEEA